MSAAVARARVLRGAVAAGALAAATDAAFAHAPVPGLGAVWNGVLHPFMVPVHLLALASLGLALGQNAPRASRPALPLFAVAFAVSLALAGPAGISAAVPGALALAAGLLVALQATSHVPLLAVTVGVAVAVGLDSAPDGAPGGWLAAAGGTLGGALLTVVLAGGLSAAATAPWQRIGVRAAGSWIAAASVLVLALFLRP